MLSAYIKKLYHPLQEIRERSLQLLVAKLRLGWVLDDELEGTRELLNALINWLNIAKPTLQKEVFELILETLKTKTGNYIAKEFGIKKILSTLLKLKQVISPDAIEVYNDVMETLQFLNTLESDENVCIPKLHLKTDSSESDTASSSGYCNINLNYGTSKETSLSQGDVEIGKTRMSKSTDSLRVILFPWAEMCSSDIKTVLLVEDAIKLLKSTRRCCRFICDVFLRDFPPEIFLNRPSIIQNLLCIANGYGRRPGEALYVLLCITRALCTRLLQLSSLELIHGATKIAEDEDKDSLDNVNVELEQIAGAPRLSPSGDGLEPLKQLPAPIYALDTLQVVFAIISRSLIIDDNDDRKELLDVKELNTCLTLVEYLVQLLLDSVSETFWTIDHNTKTHRDVAHKSCMVMRQLGELLTKCKKYTCEESHRNHRFVCWIRLLCSAERLARWARGAATSPASLALSLQTAQIVPSLELFYPELAERISTVIQSSNVSLNQDYKSKYREMMALTSRMDDAVKFMKNKNNFRKSKSVFECILNSLSVLDLHLNENYVNDVAEILLFKTKSMDMSDDDWVNARSIALRLMAHRLEWVSAKFYLMMADMVKSIFVEDISDNEKLLTLLCDVGVLTEICCHGLSSDISEVYMSANELMSYLLRGRLILNESSWWRLLANLMPVLPLLHAYAAHDTPLGQAICKSLEAHIAQCMGVSEADRVGGLARLLFVRCAAVQLDAAHSVCKELDDERYLPPKESLRADILLNALRRLEPQNFNINFSTSPTKALQPTGLIQILDVLKQDIVVDEYGIQLVSRSSVQPTLEPSLRRSTLQQLSVLMQQQELHETFLQSNGLKVIVAILRMSLMVDDYLAFPECAISCVSVLNSVSFISRHNLAKIPDLIPLLLRVILVFPANESAVVMSAQVIALVSWAGFVLQELDEARRRVPALPQCVTQRTSLPFPAKTYWTSSPNSAHSSIEWLLTEEEWRAAIRVRWWLAWEGPRRVLRGSLNGADTLPAPLALRPTLRDTQALRVASPIHSCTTAILALQNATSHSHVIDAINTLESYIFVLPLSSADEKEFASVPWQHTQRFLLAPPASPNDTELVIALLKLFITYMDNVSNKSGAKDWIIAIIMESDSSLIELLSRDQLYPQQTAQETIEVTQLHIHIVKLLLRCIIALEYQEIYNSGKLESLIKILLRCLEKLDLKNFHMLGYLNELMRCIRYALNSRHCKLSEETVIQCMKLMTETLSGCASSGGRKGQACRLDATLALLTLLKRVQEDSIPVQRWSESWAGSVVEQVTRCAEGGGCERVELRAGSLRLLAALAHYAQLLPHLIQAISHTSLAQYAVKIFCHRQEANVVRAAAARLLVAVTARSSPYNDVLQSDVLEHLKENNFVEYCLEILLDFGNEKEYKSNLEPNIPLSVLERLSEFEVSAEKCKDVYVKPSLRSVCGRIPPTAGLVEAVADVVHNISIFASSPITEWNDQGLYRLLFRCASWSSGSQRAQARTRGAVCRALYAAASRPTPRVPRTTLAATNDCLHNLIDTLTPLSPDATDICVNASTQSLLLLATLLTEKSASDFVWRELKNNQASPFYHLLVQAIDSDKIGFQEAGLFCLAQLIQSRPRNSVTKLKEDSFADYFDSIQSPYFTEETKSGSGDDCRPEYLAEEICKILIHLYNKLSESKIHLLSQDVRWCNVSSCLASLLCQSRRAREYGLHRSFCQTLLGTLQGVRDHLSIHDKPLDTLKKSQHNPTLRTLYWVLTLMDCQMQNCRPAKETFAQEGIASSLCRLWPWCMMTDQLRVAVMQLLLVFSNECPEAWNAMCTCVGGRSLMLEVCSLVSREAALHSRARPHTLLLLALSTIRHTMSHLHSRAILLKSESLSSVYKLCVRERTQSRADSAWCACWARVCAAAARHAEGAAAVLALRPPPAHLAPAARAQLLPAIAHAAHHHRTTFLQSPDLLELLSGTLLTGDTAEVVSAARAVWALAANHHKAKLALRSAGVAAALQSALMRYQRPLARTHAHSATDAAHAHRALQILTYTNTVLQTT